jgi:DNA-directed RNA polymerase alpha subunit
VNANHFQNANIEYVYELAEKTEADLLRMKHFSLRSLNEVKELLAEMGLSLGMKLGPNFPRVREIRENLYKEVDGLVPKDSNRWHDSVPTLLTNWFQNHNFRYVFELTQCSREHLLRKRGMGALMLDRVEAALEQMGLFLGMTLEDEFFRNLPEDIKSAPSVDSYLNPMRREDSRGRPIELRPWLR